MAYFEGHSLYRTNCKSFKWKFVNYDKTVAYDSMYSGGSRLYAPDCSEGDLTYNMFFRPIDEPCLDCPYYEEGDEKGSSPPGGYNV